MKQYHALLPVQRQVIRWMIGNFTAANLHLLTTNGLHLSAGKMLKFGRKKQ